MEASPKWPPTNLSQWNQEELNSVVDACQVEEMGLWLSSTNSSNSSGSSQARSSFWHALVQLVALLRLGEYGHARHVYRRWKDAGSNGVPPWTEEECEIFESWFRVGKAMMTDQLDVVWIGLWEMMQVQQPEPFKTYAQEVADAYYNQRLLPILKRRFSKATTRGGGSDPFEFGRQVPSLSLYLQAYQGWKLEGNVLKPPPDAIATTQRLASQQPLSLTSGSNKELLQLIAFLENPQLQA